VIAALALVFLSIVIGFASSILTTIVAIAYPVYKSFLAIESKSSNDDQQWLTYWVVYSLFYFIDEVFGCLLTVIPFYALLRVCFFVWMFLPTTQGATKIYSYVVKPLLSKYGDKIDATMGKMENFAFDAAKDLKNVAKE
jgi:receptor expression-enhancing protein 5/6